MEKEFGYRLLKPILSPIFKLYYRPIVIGKEKIPKTGPIILAGNHRHLFDQCLVIISTKRVIHYMAKKEYFDGHFSWFFKFTGTIPVDRSKHDKVAKERAIKVLENDGAIGIFPEGTRNKTKDLLLPFKYGAVSMARLTGAVIVPFAITGSYKFRSDDLMIKFGEPFKVGEDENLESANLKLKKTIEILLGEDF